MYHFHVKKNKPLLSILLFLSFGQSLHSASDLVPWYYPPFTINKKYVMGSVAGLAGLLVLYNIFNKKNEKAASPKNNLADKPKNQVPIQPLSKPTQASIAQEINKTGSNSNLQNKVMNVESPQVKRDTNADLLIPSDEDEKPNTNDSSHHFSRMLNDMNYEPVFQSPSDPKMQPKTEAVYKKYFPQDSVQPKINNEVHKNSQTDYPKIEASNNMLSDVPTIETSDSPVNQNVANATDINNKNSTQDTDFLSLSSLNKVLYDPTLEEQPISLTSGMQKPSDPSFPQNNVHSKKNQTTPNDDPKQNPFASLGEQVANWRLNELDLPVTRHTTPVPLQRKSDNKPPLNSSYVSTGCFAFGPVPTTSVTQDSQHGPRPLDKNDEATSKGVITDTYVCKPVPVPGDNKIDFGFIIPTVPLEPVQSNSQSSPITNETSTPLPIYRQPGNNFDEFFKSQNDNTSAQNPYFNCQSIQTPTPPLSGIGIPAQSLLNKPGQKDDPKDQISGQNDIEINIVQDDDVSNVNDENKLDKGEYLKIFNEVSTKYDDILSDDFSFKKGFLESTWSMNGFVKYQVKDMGKNEQEVQIALAKQALNACVLVDKKCSQLIIDFLNFKHNCGTAVERKFYKTEFNDLENNKKGCIVKFITRLLCCVPIMFMTKEDWTVLHQTDGLKNGAMYFNVSKKDFFDNLPKDSENIKKYITYDEMRIAALIGRYTNIFPINNGSRDYAGEQMGTDYYEDVEVGVASLTGSRFERKGKMEYQDVIIDAENNTVENGYGLKKNYSTDQHTFLINIWEKFWKTTFPTYEEAQKLSNEYVPLYLHNNYSNKYGHKENDPIIFFNTCVQKKRIGLVVSLQLNKIISKYKNTDDKVYISVAGLGSGEWAKIPGPDQNTLYAPKDMPMGTFIECLQIQVYQNLLEKLLQEDAQALDRITDIDYAFFGFKLNDPKHTIAQYDIIETHFKNVKNVNKDDKNLHRIYTITIGQKDINFHLSQRTAFAKLKNEDVGKKIEAMYAADSNAFPGNEAWVGKVRATGEASMISSTAGVGALLNPKINTSLLRNIQMY